MEVSVRPRRGKSAVLVECDRVHRVHRCLSTLLRGAYREEGAGGRCSLRFFMPWPLLRPFTTNPLPPGRAGGVKHFVPQGQLTTPLHSAKMCTGACTSYRDSMALEGKTLLGAAVRNGLVPGRLRLGGLLAEVLDANTPLDRPHREALLVWEDRNAPKRGWGEGERSGNYNRGVIPWHTTEENRKRLTTVGGTEKNTPSPKETQVQETIIKKHRGCSTYRSTFRRKNTRPPTKDTKVQETAPLRLYKLSYDISSRRYSH